MSHVKKNHNSSKKTRPIFLKILLFVLDIFMVMLTSNRSKHKPTLQEVSMGEPIPMSDDYYIPDDKC